MDDNRKFIIITDLEPDDKIALHIIAAKIPHEQILFVGVTIMDTYKKKLLTRRLLDQLGLIDIPVYQGTGGTSTSYYDIESSKAAREYNHDEDIQFQLNDIISSDYYSGEELQNNIEKSLSSHNNINIILLAPPTDLMIILSRDPSLSKNINSIYVMGGWNQCEDNLRSTYNWNMDPISTYKLLDIKDIPIILYSSHIIKRLFLGGSINTDTYPKIFKLINKYKQNLPSLVDLESSMLSWNSHVIKTIPSLINIIGKYNGKQFTPADPLVVIGIINNNLIKETKNVRIKIDIDDIDKSKGFRIFIEQDHTSNISLITDMNVSIFENEIIDTLKILNKQLGE